MYPIISVVIPNYNRERAIYETICSALKQTYKNIEVIVVDDASTDGSVNELKRIQDKRFKFLVLEKHCGANACRNVGVRASNGEYIAFLDSGTFWNESKLDKQFNRIVESPNSGLVYCIMKTKKEDMEQYTPDFSMDLCFKEERCTEILVKGNFIDTSTIMISRKCFEQIGGFDERLLRWQDYDFVLRVVQQFPIVIVNEELVETKLYSNSITSRVDFLAQSVPIIIEKNYNFLVENGGLETLLISIVATIMKESSDYIEAKKYCQYLNHELNQICQDKIIQYFDERMNLYFKEYKILQMYAEYDFQCFMKNVRDGVSFIIYGSGMVAQALIDRFRRLGYLEYVKKIAVTTIENLDINKIEGVPIVLIDDLIDEINTPVLIGVAEKTQMEIYNILTLKHFTNIHILMNSYWKYID